MGIIFLGAVLVAWNIGYGLVRSIGDLRGPRPAIGVLGLISSLAPLSILFLGGVFGWALRDGLR